MLDGLRSVFEQSLRFCKNKISYDFLVRRWNEECEEVYKYKQALIAEERAKHQPTADVVKVKRGEWELKSETHRFLEEVDEEFYIECPFCHRVYYVPFEFEDEKMIEYARKNYPYCHCGAKMDGGKADGKEES